MNPDLLLMDEPYGQMDIKLRFYLEEEVSEIMKENRCNGCILLHTILKRLYILQNVS